MKILCSLMLSISLLFTSIDFSTLISILFNDQEITEVYLNNELVWASNESLVVFENNTITEPSMFSSYVNATLSSSIQHYNFDGDIKSDYHTSPICAFTEETKQRYPYMVVEYNLKSQLKTPSGGSNSGAITTKINIDSASTAYDEATYTGTVITTTQDIIHSASCYWAGSIATAYAKIDKITLYAKDPTTQLSVGVFE